MVKKSEKVISGGERAYILNILFKYNDEKIVLDSHKSQDVDAVINSLEKIDKQVLRSGITITIDNGKEFKNNRVADYCSQNSITLNFTNPGSPWENGFVERDMRTLKEECLNLIWINNIIY
jgi:putative transposase